jgi:GntR family transcriptional repressor for pyruvate dehydrogenase complex
MVVKSTDKKRQSESVIEKIKDLIISNNLGPGAQLPSERKLTTALKISRSSVREAHRMLEIMGLIEVKPGKGAYVKRLSGDLFMPLSSLLSTHKESLHQHFEARLLLEPAAAAFAAKRASHSDIDQLRKALETFQESLDKDNLVSLIRADILFHRLVANATNNRTIEVLMNTITRHNFIGWQMSLRTNKRPLRTVKEHGKIFEAIVAGDEKKAKSAMRSHLKAAIKNLRQAGFE